MCGNPDNLNKVNKALLKLEACLLLTFASSISGNVRKEDGTQEISGKKWKLLFQGQTITFLEIFH